MSRAYNKWEGALKRIKKEIMEEYNHLSYDEQEIFIQELEAFINEVVYKELEDDEG